MLAQALLFVSLVVALAALLVSLLRRRPQRIKPTDAAPHAAAAAVASAPGSKALGRDEVLRKLNALAFGAEPRGSVPPAQVEIVAAIGATIESAATDSRYAPRRPL